MQTPSRLAREPLRAGEHGIAAQQRDQAGRQEGAEQRRADAGDKDELRHRADGGDARRRQAPEGNQAGQHIQHIDQAEAQGQQRRSAAQRVGSKARRQHGCQHRGIVGCASATAGSACTKPKAVAGQIGEEEWLLPPQTKMPP